MTAGELVVAPATASELREIEEIEATSFRQPWPAGSLAQELERPFARLVCAKVAGRVLGYSNYWIVADEANLLSIAVAPDYRGRGIASALLAELLATARARGCSKAWLEVRRGNAIAIGLYRRHGFERTGERRRYYSDGEDAVLMALDLARRGPATAVVHHEVK